MYANINGSRKQIFKKINRYMWHAYSITGWTDKKSTTATVEYVNDTCSNCGSSWSRRTGCAYPISSYVYSSYSFNSSTGTYSPSGSSLYCSLDTAKQDSSYYKGYYYINRRYLFKLGYFSGGEQYCSCGNYLTSSTGFDFSEYRYAKPNGYNDSSYIIITSTNRREYKNGYGYYYYEGNQDYYKNDYYMIYIGLI